MKKFILAAAIIFLTLTTANAEIPKVTEKRHASAIFAGGCFWCMQPVFDSFDGVFNTTVGYSGGHTKDINYEKLNEHNTGHYEVIKVDYDSEKVRYEELVRVFFANIDPFDATGQFADKGQQYQSVIFYKDEEQKKIAEKIIAEVAAKFPGKKIAVKLLPKAEFYAAEDYHQDYYKKNPVRYEAYKYGSGRATGVKKIWEGKKP